ncbi:MAG TPA: BtpA/SgcQ family protein, partial [Methylomirabilota bacterium]|nr:BtpA/SgcQ family protein [Methylomirabilota bacterium]
MERPHYSRALGAVSTAGRVLQSRTAMRLIGMVHLPPLPGSPRWAGSMERVIAAALADARTLV